MGIYFLQFKTGVIKRQFNNNSIINKSEIKAQDMEKI
jgi:hypothetical protein